MVCLAVHRSEGSVWNGITWVMSCAGRRRGFLLPLVRVVDLGGADKRLPGLVVLLQGGTEWCLIVLADDYHQEDSVVSWVQVVS